MANGKLNFVKSVACPNGPPKGGVWFPVSVTVHGQDVQVYHSGVLVASVKSHFAPRAWGGVFTFLAYKNVILFKKFKVAPQTLDITKAVLDFDHSMTMAVFTLETDNSSAKSVKIDG